MLHKCQVSKQNLRDTHVEEHIKTGEGEEVEHAEEEDREGRGESHPEGLLDEAFEEKHRTVKGGQSLTLGVRIVDLKVELGQVDRRLKRRIWAVCSIVSASGISGVRSSSLR